MLRKFTLLILVFISISVLSQTNVDENEFEIIFKSDINVHPAGEFKLAPYKITVSGDFKMIRIKVLVKSSSKYKQLFDPNKMYLISKELCQRYRPVDIQYKIMIGHYVGAERITNDINLSNGKTKKWYNGDVGFVRYAPEIKDTFRDYIRPNYKDNETIVNHGSNRNPQNVVVYYDHKEIDSKVMLIYFKVPYTFENGDFYYGHKMVYECVFD